VTESDGRALASKRSKAIKFRLVVCAPTLAVIRLFQPTLAWSEQRPSSHELWLAVRKDEKEGTGTVTDPFDGSGSNFDSKLGAYAASGTTDLTIHLGVGTFTTTVSGAGNIGAAFYMKSGWRIIGAGRNVTTLQMTGNMAGKHFDVEAFKTNSSVVTNNISISDLTIDCNYGALSANADTAKGEKFFKSGGIALFGSNNIVRNVRVVNSYGSFANGQESFAILLAGRNFAGGTANVIDSCIVESPASAQTSGAPFALFGTAKSKVIDCKAIGLNNGGSRAGFNSGGVNIADLDDCEIARNTFVDCAGLVYHDTGTVNWLRIVENSCIRGWTGIGLVATARPAWGAKRVEIIRNRINLQNRSGENDGIKISNNLSADYSIRNNTIDFTAGGRGIAAFHSFLCRNAVRSVFHDNVVNVDSAGGSRHDATATGKNVVRHGNRTTTGQIIEGLEDTD
jgi:hypothetical protein